MSKRVVLLTPSEEWDGLRRRVLAVAPQNDVRHARTLGDLQAEVPNLNPGDRVISFATPVIVPGDVLDQLPGPAYNFHNGPPAYPGLFPACFALYDGAATFGATAHEMTAELDQGPIVAVELCDMPDGIDRFNLEALSRQLLDRIDWGTRVTRKADFEALCRLPVDVDAVEFERRLRAVGEGPYHALRIEVHGRSFALEPLEHVSGVYRGGQRTDS